MKIIMFFPIIYILSYSVTANAQLIAKITPDKMKTKASFVSFETMLGGKIGYRLMLYSKDRKPLSGVGETGRPAAICSDKDYIVVGLKTGELKLYDLNLKLLKSIKTIPLFSISCGGGVVVAGGKSLKILKFSMSDLKPMKKVGEQSSWISKIISVPDLGIVFSGSWSHHARLWLKNRFITLKIYSPVRDATFIKGGNLFATISDDDKIRFFDSKTGRRTQWARVSNPTCVVSNIKGDMVLVGLGSGYVYKFVKIGKKFKKKGAIKINFGKPSKSDSSRNSLDLFPLKKTIPVRTLLQLDNGWWAIIGNTKTFFQKIN